MHKVQKGRILLYRVFDIGEEINLEKAERIIVDETTRSRFKLKRKDSQSVNVAADPLRVGLGLQEIIIEGIVHKFELNAKIWAFGTFSLTFEYHIPEQSSLKELAHLANIFEDSEEIDEYARLKAREFTQKIQSAMLKTNEWNVYEDYLIFFIEKFDQNSSNTQQDLTKFLEDEDIPALILTENHEAISDHMKEKILGSKLQYYKNDLAVIDWNSALIVEPTGLMDIPDVIEFALNQLLEMRYYDELLDKELNQIYSDSLKNNESAFNSQFLELAKGASQKYIEIAEIVETVENSLKIIGDQYLSMVFRTASTKFRFKDWQNSIDNKLENLANLSNLLSDNVHHKRSNLLEIIIIILISIEVVPFLYGLFMKWMGQG